MRVCREKKILLSYYYFVLYNDQLRKFQCRNDSKYKNNGHPQTTCLAFYKRLQDFEHFGIVKPRNNHPYEARPFLIVVNIPLIPHILTWSLNCCVRGGIEALAGKGGGEGGCRAPGQRMGVFNLLGLKSDFFLLVWIESLGSDLSLYTVRQN